MPEPTAAAPTKMSSKSQGMVLGPDGKPCKPCTAFRNWKPRTGAPKEGEPSSKSNSGSADPSRAFAAMLAPATTPATTSGPPSDCPADVETLGNATWTFLHTTVAYFPSKPTPGQRAHMLNLLHSLPVLYPCSHCAQHLGECMRSAPPDVRSGESLGQWLCERHNEVNEMLGKDRYDCAKVRERWKDGWDDGRCD